MRSGSGNDGMVKRGGRGVWEVGGWRSMESAVPDASTGPVASIPAMSVMSWAACAVAVPAGGGAAA